MTWRIALVSILLTACADGASTLGSTTDNEDSADPYCSAFTPAQLHDAALNVYNTETSDPQNCFVDETCPCGTYCSVFNECEADCVPNPAPGEPTCGAGKACTTAGRCADAPNDPPPPLAMSIAFGAPATSANTTTGPVTLQINVTTTAFGQTSLDDAEDATVHFSIQKQFDDPPSVSPLIKCTIAGSFTTDCDLAGGWIYDVAGGTYHSQPRQIWVQVPQTSTPLQWTLEARSANTLGTATEVLNATPVVTPATDPGHYKGTLSYGNSVANQAISIPVEATVTAGAIVVIEPTKLVFADGEAVIARATNKETRLGWVGAATGRYDVLLQYVDAAYDPTRGHLDATLALLDGTGAESTSISLSLDRTGDVATCPCAADSYCDTEIGACVPGSAPTDQAFVDPATAKPSTTLASASFAAWAPLVKTAATGTPALNGTGLIGFEQAYCFNGTSTPGTIGGLSMTSPMSPTSGDLQCLHGAAAQPQTTFAFEEHPTEFADGTAGGGAFDLFQTCLSDLAVHPTGSTPATLLPSRACASLGQFFLALEAHDPSVPLADIDQRLVMQLLRQWLGVTAYVANTAVQERDYNDALSVSGAPAYDQFKTTLDQVDANLRVLIDPAVLPQYSTGAGLTGALVRPDYRVRLRPRARWSFNDSNPSTVPVVDAEGSNPLIHTGASLVGSALFAQGQPGANCRSTNPIDIKEGRRYSIVLALDFNPPAGQSAMVFYKKASSDFLRVDASPGSAAGLMTLRMYDQRNGSITFRDVPSGLIAISADDGTYALYSAASTSPTTVVTFTGQSLVNGGPIWGAPGLVELNCNLPPNPNVCTSWDRNSLYDGLDYKTRAPYVVHSATSRWSCNTYNSAPDSPKCSGPAPSAQTCTNTATAMRPTLVNQIRAVMVNPVSPPPAGPLAALTTHGSVVDLDDVIQPHPTFTTEYIDWRCDTTVTGYIDPVTGPKAVCGGLQATYDEVSVWDRPVQPAEVVAMAQQYTGVATNQTMPVAAALDGSEQPTALPVHMLEAAAADLELLAAYADAARSLAYGECYEGGHSAALDEVAQRGGPNLRLVSVLEDEADHLLAVAGGTSASWYLRYSAAKQQLAGRRALAVQALLETVRCENPLGISEQNIPLYVGEDEGANAKFFASSHYLASEAQAEITTASQLLGAARTAYTNQREQEYQLDEAAATKEERKSDLRANTEAQLSHYCGSAQGTTSLLDALQGGTMSSDNCFIDRQLPECTNLATPTLESLPVQCLRGELGNQVLTIKTAGIVMTNADNTMHDTIDRYNGDLEHCAQEQAAFEQDETALRDHDAEMDKLHKESALFDTMMGVVKAGLSSPADIGPGIIGAVTAGGDAAFAVVEADEQNTYNEGVMHRSHDEQLANCFHDTDNEKYQIDNARDQLVLAKQQLENATHQFTVEVDQVVSISTLAGGQLATLDTLSATPPHLHFWLDQSISDYHRHLEAARRLTYLALRALEYEAQESLGLRSTTLTAAIPSVLQTVVADINAVNAPLAGQLGVSIEETKLVFSLRDDIMFRSQSTGNVSGDPQLTPVQQFQRYMKSRSSIIFDANQKPIGRGIRFSVVPNSLTATMCDERLWRIQPSLQIDDPPNQHSILLYQDNTFGSQDCHADPGTVLVSHADPAGALLVDNSFALPQLALPQPYVVSNIDGPTGLTPEGLRGEAETSVSTFAGRGLYGSYILLFPASQWTDAQIANIKDVLLRFDINDVANAPHI